MKTRRSRVRADGEELLKELIAEMRKEGPGREWGRTRSVYIGTQVHQSHLQRKKRKKGATQREPQDL